MPMITYLCEKQECGATSSFLYRKSTDAPKHNECKTCGSPCKKTLSKPSSVSKITVDNGLQARAVEMYPDVMEVRADHSKNGYNRGD